MGDAMRSLHASLAHKLSSLRVAADERRFCLNDLVASPTARRPSTAFLRTPWHLDALHASIRAGHAELRRMHAEAARRQRLPPAELSQLGALINDLELELNRVADKLNLIARQRVSETNEETLRLDSYATGSSNDEDAQFATEINRRSFDVEDDGENRTFEDANSSYFGTASLNEDAPNHVSDTGTIISSVIDDDDVRNQALLHSSDINDEVDIGLRLPDIVPRRCPADNANFYQTRRSLERRARATNRRHAASLAMKPVECSSIATYWERYPYGGASQQFHRGRRLDRVDVSRQRMNKQRLLEEERRADVEDGLMPQRGYAQNEKPKLKRQSVWY